MPTKIGVYYGVGKFNKGEIFAYSAPYYLADALHTISGDEGFERVKIADTVLELGELPDFDKLMRNKREELIKQEQERHFNRMKAIRTTAA